MEIEVGQVIKKAKIKRCGDGNYPVLSMTMRDGLMFQSGRFKKQIASVDQSNYQIVSRHQLVEGFPIDEGVLSVQELTDEGIVSPAYKIWDVDMTKVEPVFLELALRSQRSIEYYKSKLRGTTARRRSITDTEFCAMRIPCPDLNEQKKIIDLIEKIKIIKQKREEELYELDNLIKARFVEMFGNPIHPAQFKKLGDIALLERGRFSPRPRNDPRYFGGEYPFIQTGDIASSNHRLFEYKQTLNEEGIKVSKKFNVGTIVMAIVGATIGATSILQREVYAPDSVIGISPYKYDNVFLEVLLQFWKPQLLAIAPESARANINLGILNDIPIIDVSVEKQESFSSFAKQVDKSKVAVQKALDETQLLFNSLMQEYFG